LSITYPIPGWNLINRRFLKNLPFTFFTWIISQLAVAHFVAVLGSTRLQSKIVQLFSQGFHRLLTRQALKWHSPILSDFCFQTCICGRPCFCSWLPARLCTLNWTRWLPTICSSCSRRSGEEELSGGTIMRSFFMQFVWSGASGSSCWFAPWLRSTAEPYLEARPGRVRRGREHRTMTQHYWIHNKIIHQSPSAFYFSRSVIHADNSFISTTNGQERNGTNRLYDTSHLSIIKLFCLVKSRLNFNFFKN